MGIFEVSNPKKFSLKKKACVVYTPPSFLGFFLGGGRGLSVLSENFSLENISKLLKHNLSVSIFNNFQKLSFF